MNRSSLAYVSVVTLAGFVVIVHALRVVLQAPPPVEWFLLATLTLLTSRFTVKVPSLPALLSVSETFVFASVLLFGAAAGTLTVVLDSLFIILWMKRATRSVPRILFNATAPAIAIWLASEAFFLLAHVEAGGIRRDDVSELIIPIFVLGVIYFLVNTALVAGALATEQRESVARLWLRHFPAVSISYLVGSSTALLLVAFSAQIDLTVLSIIVPLLLISYITFRTSMGRLDDANRHIEQVNELYMSTIETLAMAVDAKDQITHGHIRRVQVFALELAKRLGVADDRELKAIAAAALLHDMGKLAIPEHILNKPGRLTPAEFDRMKQHAGLGADLLSSIRFPYPVVPIVRHHHESWDGTGYPSGIAGTDIPLGARILSVVDCFDALTSDRPYRPRLSVDDAFAILRERRATMYDPLVVDTFIHAYPQIGPMAIKAGQEARSIFPADGVTISTDPSIKPLKQIRANAAEAALLNEARERIHTGISVQDVLDRAAQCLRQFIPVTVLALYRYRPESDTVVCEATVGDLGKLLEGLTIRAGQKITGWSGAMRRTSINSDAALDLAQISEMFDPALRSALSVPLTDGPKLLGVLTAYSIRENAFNESHRYIAEQIGSLLSERLGALASLQPSSVVPFATRPKTS